MSTLTITGMSKRLLIWQPLYKEIEDQVSSGDKVLLLIAPYIKLGPLKSILNSCRHTDQIKIVSRWAPQDIISSVSDLSIYPFLKENKIPLYINSKIHLKLYIYRSNRGFHTSGNITSAGLGYGENNNIELGCNVNLSSSDWQEVYSIIENSLIVDDTVYEVYIKYLNDNKDKRPPLPKLILPKDPIKEYSINRLPATDTPVDLWKYYSDRNSIEDPELVQKAIHDLVLYGLGKAELDKEMFLRCLERAFKSESFIRDLALMIKESGSCRFGAVNDWIHRKCMDVPLPYKWELKENTRTLYAWLSTFYKEIEWNVPGKHSQVIYWKT